MAAPTMLPSPTAVSMRVTGSVAPSEAPTCSVVATMLAAAKSRNRSQPDWVRASTGTGERSAACTATYLASRAG